MDLRFLLTRPSRDVTEAMTLNVLTATFLLTRPSRDVTGSKRRCVPQIRFLLTRPSRDVTFIPRRIFAYYGISTHTPLAGRDGAWVQTRPTVPDFYSHAPRGT